ncbi:hypothetical protein [Hymenobacter psoromatis]|uniref:hypothetical protein n=1 Tax=Hymenobacter psoromatis TaxID=1484116 RepID=UPI001CBF228F|nr:hypothetical protein [Hymenobacter psoromatis]
MNLQPKALLLAAGLALAGATVPTAAHAQVGINIQLGHPAWGPAVPAGAQYYYVPEIDGYYDLAARNYIVQRNGQWVPMATLPGYNPATFHPVVVNYRGRQPWAQYRDHHARYYRPVVVRQVNRPVLVERVNRRGQVVERRVR